MSDKPQHTPHFGYARIVKVFDEDETAGSFLNDDGEGGFSAGVYRMAREIERLTEQRDALAGALQQISLLNAQGPHISAQQGMATALAALDNARILACNALATLKGEDDDQE